MLKLAGSLEAASIFEGNNGVMKDKIDAGEIEAFLLY